MYNLVAPPMPPTPEILNFGFSGIFGFFMASPRSGRRLKSFLEAARFISTHREPVASHGDPIRDQNCGFGPAPYFLFFLKTKKLPCNNDFFFRIALKQIRTHLDSCATSCYIDIFEYPLWFCPPEVSYEI